MAFLLSFPGKIFLWRQLQRLRSLFHDPPFAPPGHFYSPIPDRREGAREAERAFRDETTGLGGIDLRADAQLALLRELAAYYGDLPFAERKTADLRYYYDNIYFRHMDAIVLYSLLRRSSPRRVVEIGSGFSSALMLDACRLFLPRQPEFTFIEPFPQRLQSLLRVEDAGSCRILDQPVQQVPLSLFESLEAGDFLLVDSSHTAKTGGDVNHLLFNILPVLKPGVFAHFHDIFWPFEYPPEWLREGRAWNEAYFLRAFLQYNQSFEIVLFNSFAGRMWPDFLRQNMPLALRDTGGSVWLRKIR